MRTKPPSRLVPCLVVLLAAWVRPSTAANRALVHGIDYDPAKEKWYFEGTQFQIALTSWINDWPFASVTRGIQQPDANDIRNDFAALPPMQSSEFFIYFYSGHGSFVPQLPNNETCSSLTPRHDVDGVVPPLFLGSGPALNEDCDEVLSPYVKPAGPPPVRVISDDELLSIFNQPSLAAAPILAIAASCYAGGLYNGHDVAGPPGDIEAGNRTALIAATSENEAMTGRNGFLCTLTDALRPVLFGSGALPSWYPAADLKVWGGNQDGQLTVQEWWGFIEARIKPVRAPRFGMDDCGCPAASQSRGEGEVAGGPGIPLNPRFYDDGGIVGGRVVANILPPNAIGDFDGDGLFDHQEPWFGTSPAAKDTDTDGLTDFEELSRIGTDPTNPDTDQDTIADGADCDPRDGANRVSPARPGEVGGVRFTNKSTFEWDATPGAASYDIVRGALGALPVGPDATDETCLATAHLATNFTDASDPLPGLGIWILVRAVDACGRGGYGFVHPRLVCAGERITTTCDSP